MPPGLTIKDNARESSLFRSRVIIGCTLVGLLSLVLLVRLAKLQIVDHEHFKTLSHENRVRIVPIPPTRGLIFDRNGIVLAENTPTYSLEIIPESVEDMDATLLQLRGIVDLQEDDIAGFHRLMKRRRHFQSIPIRIRLSDEEVARFAVNRHRFPGVDIHARLSRYYPHGALGVHAVGYVARIDEEELKRVDTANYRGTSYIGKTGVEQFYESTLHGQVGYQHVEVNAQGRTLRVLDRTPPVPGRNLYLTIDASLQARAEAALGSENGAVVAIDPATGGILALASMPVFDPNLFVNGIRSRTYRALLSSPERPMFNRSLHGQYPPGSTLKPFVALAGLELAPEHTREDAWCPGWFRLSGHQHRYRDWKKGGHGWVGLQKAIVESCDVYFYQLAMALGIDGMHAFLGKFGFGDRTGIDLTGEAAGLLPSREWKRATRGQPWYPGETLITGIGQGFTLVTPLQLASATATLASRGVRLQPRIVARIDEPDPGQWQAFPAEPLGSIETREAASWPRIVESMVNVVHGLKGTARRISVGAAYRIAGKTGTAQVIGVGQNEEYKEDEVPKKLRDHGLFIAFAPPEKARIAVAVVVENGGGGGRSAAPVARKVMDHFFGSKAGEDDEGLLLTSNNPVSTPQGGVSEGEERTRQAMP